MAEERGIPVAAEVMTAGELSTELEEWLESMRDSIGRGIRRSASSGSVSFHFSPFLVQGSKQARMWNVHHQLLVDELCDKGYTVEVLSLHGNPVGLGISIRGS